MIFNKKVPEGATHWRQDFTNRQMDNIQFYQLETETGYRFWSGGEETGKWVYGGGVTPRDLFKVTELERSEPWAGEGLPPPETVCEVTTPAMDGSRIKVTIKYVGETRIIAHDGRDERCWLISHCTFYPISTAEQIAAEERMACAKEFHSLVCPEGKWHKLDDAAREAWASIYDAGYRKQVAPIPEEDTSDIDFSIKAGDTVQKDSWEHGHLEVIDVNWALRAVAVRLNPAGGIVVWPARGMKKVTP